MTRCRYCRRPLWRTALGIACEECDALAEWPNVRGTDTASSLQADCDRIIRGTVYDWEREGDL